MIGEISAGLGSLKAAKDIIQGLNAAATQATVNEVKISLQSLILEAQTALFAAQQAEAALTGRIAELEQEIVRLKDWSAEKQRYHLVNAGSGSVAYMPKPGMENGQPAHWLCANCFDQGRRSFIQFKGSMGIENLFGCIGCGDNFKAWGALPTYPDPPQDA